MNREFENIDWSKKRCIMFDVDDTVSYNCREINKSISKEIDSLIYCGFVVGFISGTDVMALKKMISVSLEYKHHLLGNSGGNYSVMENNKENTIYQYILSEEERTEIFNAIDLLINKYNIKSLTSKKDQVLDRVNQITLSCIGRHAPANKKQQFDPDEKKRRLWIEFLRCHISSEKYEFRIGGKTSIDITKKGMDKSFGLKEFSKRNNISFDEIVYFGDKCYPGGNDYPAVLLVDTILVNNPKHTLKLIRQIPKPKYI